MDSIATAVNELAAQTGIHEYHSLILSDSNSIAPVINEFRENRLFCMHEQYRIFHHSGYIQLSPEIQLSQLM